MIRPPLFPSAGALAREVGDAARGALWRGAPAAIEGMLALIGAGFVIFAGYAALRPVTGPALAALATGLVLIALAVALARISGHFDPSRKPGEVGAQVPVPAPAPATPPQPQDAVTMAAFTAAFVLGRWLADTRR